jgi:hypothetical protein
MALELSRTIEVHGAVQASKLEPAALGAALSTSGTAGRGHQDARIELLHGLKLQYVCFHGTCQFVTNMQNLKKKNLLIRKYNQ